MQTQEVIHPSEVVRNLIDETGMSITKAAERLMISRQQLTRILGEQSGISPEMALRLELVFGSTAEDYLKMQTDYELAQAREDAADNLAELRPFKGFLKKRNRDYVIEKLRTHKIEFKKLGLMHLYLFGSVARREANVDSDVDLYYVANPKIPMSLVQLGTIETLISEILDLPVDLVPGKSFRKNIKKNVDQDKIQVF